MKNSVKVFILTLAITVMLAMGSVTALAADYEHCAEALQTMGLLQGSASGFELDRTATRAEAAVMLVRLLGAEQEAQSNAYSHPFTDVPDWASPYIGYMYEKGLTKGVSATTFNPQGICDLRTYSTFVLRALGYTEAAKDFSYAEAEAFAMNLGVADIINASGNFNRDNLVAISYTALFAPPKGADNTLLEQLIEQGAVQAEAAQPYLQTYNTYATLQNATAKLYDKNNEPLEMKLDLTMNMDMGEQGNMKIGLDTLMQMDVTAAGQAATVEEVLAALDKIKFAMANKIAVSGSAVGNEQMDVVLDLYLLDNVLYLNNNIGKVMGDETIPEKLKVDINTVLALMNMEGMDFSQMTGAMENMTAGLMPSNPYAPYYGIAMIKSIDGKDLANGNKQFNLVYIDMPNDMLNSIMSLVYGGMPEMMEAMAQVNMDCQIGECSYTLDKDGNLLGQSVSASVSQTMFAGTEMEITTHTDMTMSYEITQTGAKVKITLPGKATDYTDIFGLMGGTAEGE